VYNTLRVQVVNIHHKSELQCPSGSTKWNSVITYHFSVTLHPTLWLPSRHPVWRVNPAAVTTCFSRWRDDWQSATVINSSLVDDPTVRPPGYHLTRRQWSLLNRFWKGQGHCGTSKEMGSDRQWNACLRRHPDNVTYCWFLPADWTRRWSTTYTRCTLRHTRSKFNPVQKSIRCLFAFYLWEMKTFSYLFPLIWQFHECTCSE